LQGEGAGDVDGVPDRTTAGRRLVQKTGESMVVSRKVTRRHLKFISDLFTTIVEMRWRYHIIVFLASFVVCWLLFAGVYLAIVHAHGDLQHLDDVDWTPCIHNVFDFTSAVLFSFETQTTIGYALTPVADWLFKLALDD